MIFHVTSIANYIAKIAKTLFNQIILSSNMVQNFL